MALLLTALGFVASRRTANEPIFQGRKLSGWLDDAAYEDGNSPARNTARSAIQEIGTNALPYLLNLLEEAPDTNLDGSLTQLVKRQPWLSDRTKDRLGDQSLHRLKQAAEGFSALGTHAASATPRLIYLAGLQGGGLGNVPVFALAGIGPAAVDPLIQSLTNSTRTVGGVQQTKLGALYGLRTLQIEKAVPNLLMCIDDPDAPIREEAINALALIKPPRVAVVERLIRALHDPEVAVSRAAARALGGYGSSATNAVPVLQQLRWAAPTRSELREAVASITNSADAH